MKPTVKMHGKWLAIAAGLNQYEKADATFCDTVRLYNAGKYQAQTPIEKKIADMSAAMVKTTLKDYGINDVDATASEGSATVLMKAAMKEASTLSKNDKEIKARPTAMAEVIEQTAGMQRGLEKDCLLYTSPEPTRPY